MFSMFILCQRTSVRGCYTYQPNFAPRLIYVLVDVVKRLGRPWGRRNGRSQTIVRGLHSILQLEIGSKPANHTTGYAKALSSGQKNGLRSRSRLAGEENNSAEILTTNSWTENKKTFLKNSGAGFCVYSVRLLKPDDKYRNQWAAQALRHDPIPCFSSFASF